MERKRPQIAKYYYNQHVCASAGVHIPFAGFRAMTRANFYWRHSLIYIVVDTVDHSVTLCQTCKCIGFIIIVIEQKQWMMRYSMRNVFVIVTSPMLVCCFRSIFNLHFYFVVIFQYFVVVIVVGCFCLNRLKIIDRKQKMYVIGHWCEVFQTCQNIFIISIIIIRLLPPVIWNIRKIGFCRYSWRLKLIFNIPNIMNCISLRFDFNYFINEIVVFPNIPLINRLYATVECVAKMTRLIKWLCTVKISYDLTGSYFRLFTSMR